MLDNSWVLPYNSFMLAEFNCHINIECVISFGLIKYVNKYICKGHNCATMQINKQDEIVQFIDGCYVSALEATGHLLQLHIHDQHPNITRLQVHLSGQHLVTFDPNEDPKVILTWAVYEKTILTAFFNANADLGACGTETLKYTY